MAGAFDASIEIDTAHASQNFRALTSEVTALDAVLSKLNSTLQKGQGDLKATAQAITQIVASQRSAAKGSKELADAKMREAKAEAVVIQNQAKAAQSTANVGLTNARAARQVQLLQHAQERKAAATARATKRDQDAAAAALELEDNLSNSRYLLYDVGATYRALSLGLMAIPAATTAVAAAYENDFAQVIRTNKLAGDSSEQLSQQLKQMATDIPVGFGELSNIASIAGQLGIAESELASFTDTTARFISVTDVSLDEATKMFGRLSNSFNADGSIPDFFNKVGSAIALTGVNAVATESEIAALLGQIGPLGAQADFTAEQTIGLASAMASVRIRPELARGTLTRVFGDLNIAVANGGEKLTGYANLLGKTEEETRKLWASNPSQMFNDMVKALSQMDKFDMTRTFGEIGINAVRDQDALTKLAVNYHVLEAAMGDANKGFQEGTELNAQSAVIFDTLVNNLKEMASAFANLGASIGSGPVQLFAGLVGIITDLVQGFSSFVDQVPGLQLLLNGLMGFGAIIGIMLAIKSAQAFVVAGMIGFQQVVGKQGVSDAMRLSGTLKLLAETFLMMGGAARKSAMDVVAANGAMKSMALGGAVQLGSGLTGVAGAARTAGSVLKGALGSLLGGPLGVLTSLTIGLGMVSAGFKKVGDDADAAAERISAAMAQSDAEGFRAIADELNKDTFDAFDGASFALSGKTVKEVAESIGVSFETVVGAVAGSEEAVQQLESQMNAFAQSKGFKDFKELEDYKGFNPDKVGASAAVDKFRGKIDSLTNRMGELKGTADETDKIIETLGAEDGESGLDPLKTDAKTLTDQLKELMVQIFGFVNSESAVNAALEKLGEGLQASGSFSTGDEEGRANLANFQAVIEAKAQMYANLVSQGKMKSQEAAAEFGSFLDGLMTKIGELGGDTGALGPLAENAKTTLQNGLNSGVPLEAGIGVSVDSAEVENATNTLRDIEARYGTLDATVLVQEHGAVDVANQVTALQGVIEGATGEPYVASVGADTTAANENTASTDEYMTAVTDTPYEGTVSANTDPAISAIDHFASWAGQVLAGIGNAFVDFVNTMADLIPGASKMSHFTAPWQIAPQASLPVPKQQRPSLPVPKQRQPTEKGERGKGSQKGATDGLDSLEKGYNKAAAAADKAGNAGKKAGEKAAKALKTAAEQARDYGNRLRDALQDQYNRTYGLAEATDAYHSALNSIKKKREEEIQQVKDLAASIKDLKNQRAMDLTTAKKYEEAAKLAEKYGDTDRAADYREQAKAAKDSADATGDQISVQQKEHDTLKEGIGLMTGYSQAAIDNRAALRDLELKMLDMVGAYAAQGHSVKEVEAYMDKLGGKFKEHITQAGFNIGSNGKMIDSWDDVKGSIGRAEGGIGKYIKVIKDVPRKVETAVNAKDNTKSPTDSAKSRIRGVPSSKTTKLGARWTGAGAIKDAEKGIGKLKNKSVTITVTGIRGTTLRSTNRKTSSGQPIYKVYHNGVPTVNDIFNKGGQVKGYANGGLIGGTPPSDPRKDNIFARIDKGGSAMIRSGEFIHQQPAVDYYGLDFMDKINNMKLPRFNLGGSVGGGRAGVGAGSVQLVELTAENLQAILRLADRPIDLYADSEVLASTASDGNYILASKGAN